MAARKQTTTTPATIHGAADIAHALDVSRSTFSNYLKRYSGTPIPDYVTPDGRQFWHASRVDEWRTWAGIA